MVEETAKILLISHENTRTGAPIMLENLYYYLLKSGYDCELHYFKDIKPIYIYNLNKTRKLIVIANTLVCHPLVKWCIEQKILCIWYIHEWAEPSHYSNYGTLFKTSQFNMIVNSKIRFIFPTEKQVALYSNISKCNILDVCNIIPYGYNLHRFENLRTGYMPFKLNKKENLIYIGIIGTICSRKSQKLFIANIFKNINNIYKNTRLVLVGKLVERFSLADKLLYNNIIHIPQVQNAIPYIDAMDIIVSYSNNEVLPMNLIEAGLCGKPVLATNVGGTGDIVEDGVTGFLINKNDVKMGIIKLRTLIESKDLRISMGERAREKCCRQFNDDVTFPLFTDCINKIIE